MTFNIDVGRGCFKGLNQRPLLTEGLGLFRPTIKQVAEKARKAGLNALVIRSYSHEGGTDNTWQAYTEQAKKFGKEFYNLGKGIMVYFPNGEISNPIYLIHGQGLATDRGDIQILFTDKQIGTRNPEFKADFNYLLSSARDSGNVLITASKPAHWQMDALTKVDALEVWNGCYSNRENIASQTLANKMRKPGIIVSNSKCTEDIGSSYTSLDLAIGNQSNPEHLADGIKRALKESYPKGVRRHSTLSKLVAGLATLEVMITRNVD